MIEGFFETLFGLVVINMFGGWLIPIFMIRRNNRITMEAINKIHSQQKFMNWDIKKLINKYCS